MKSYKRLLTPKQVQFLRAACEIVTPRGKRDIAILDSFLYQGLRLTEVANLKLESFRKFRAHYTLQLKTRSTPIKIHNNLYQILKLWMDQRGMSLEKTTGPVFVPIQKSAKDVQKPLSGRTISRLVAKYGSQADITPVKGPDRLTPDDLRRTCARRAYDRGAKLVSIQAFLGFNHLETVARYIGVLDQKDTDSVIDQIDYKE